MLNNQQTWQQSEGPQFYLCKQYLKRISELSMLGVGDLVFFPHQKTIQMTILTTFEDYIIEKVIDFDVSDLNLNLIEQIAAARLGYVLKDMFLVPYTSYQEHYGDPQVAGLYFQTMLSYQREIYQEIKAEAEKIYNEGLLLEEIALLVLCSDQDNTNLIKCSEDATSYKYRLSKFRQLIIKKDILQTFDYLPMYCEQCAGNHHIKDIDFIPYFIKDNFAVAQVENEAYKLYQMLTKIFIQYYAIEALSYNHSAIISEMNDIHRRLTKDIYKLYGKITDEDIAWVKRLYETQFQVDSKRLQATNKQLALQSSSLLRKAQLLEKLKYDWYRRNFQRDIEFDQRLYENVQNHINNVIIKPPSEKQDIDKSLTYSNNVTQKYYDQMIDGISNVRNLQQSYNERKLEKSLAQSLNRSSLSSKQTNGMTFLTQVDAQDLTEDYLTKVTFHHDPKKQLNKTSILQQDKDMQVEKTRIFIKEDLTEREIKIQYTKMQPEITEAVQKRDVEILFKVVKILDEMLDTLSPSTLLFTQITSQRNKLKVMLQKYKVKH